MKVILEPRVVIVGQTIFNSHPEYDIPDDGTDAEKLGSFAAKGCYDSYGRDGRSNIENQKTIIEHAHGSVMEHAHVSFFIEGITRALSLELNRHRMFSISQRSTRYTKEEDAAIVLEPYYAQLYEKYGFQEINKKNQFGWEPTKNIPTNDNDKNEISLVSSFLLDSYSSVHAYIEQVILLELLNPLKLKGFELRKWARGKARNILPHALETRGTWTMNHRGLRWFIEARSDRHAEPEIRRLSNEIINVVRPLAPTYYEDFQVNAVVDDIPEWKPLHRKI